MPERPVWLLVNASIAIAFALPIAIAIVYIVRRDRTDSEPAPSRSSVEVSHMAAPDGASLGAPGEGLSSSSGQQILLVDDDDTLRMLLRTTLADADVEEAKGIAEATVFMRFKRPSVVILEVDLPDGNGLALCRQLKGALDPPAVILLTGVHISETEALAAGADALLRKPFSPIELLSVLERITAAGGGRSSRDASLRGDADQLLLYARDVQRLSESERTQRKLLEQAYLETTTALAEALEAKDRHTGVHALRVKAYALAITEDTSPGLLDDPSLEHGFMLHDIGKIAVPDPILNKEGPLDEAERAMVRRHPIVGTEILRNVVLLQGEGLGVVRSHHERWDGAGYPDGLSGADIPLGARIFAVADALDAMTTDRPYRRAMGWESAVDEIVAQKGRQFDPRVVDAFTRRESRLRRMYGEFVGRVAA